MYEKSNFNSSALHDSICHAWTSTPAEPRSTSEFISGMGRPHNRSEWFSEITHPTTVCHPRRPYLIYMVAARRVHAHPLGRRRHRCLSDLRRRRRTVLRPATGPLGQLYAAAIQRHVPIYRSRCIITAPVHINIWQKEVAASVIPSVASSKKES